jgi:hypothetical protein
MLGIVTGMQAESHRITTADVVTSLKLDAGSVRITMPYVVSRGAHPSLRLMSQQGHERRVLARIGCERAMDCLPFYAEIEFPSSVEAEQFSTQTHTVSTVPRRRPDTPIVRGGSIAELEIRVRAIRLLLHVRCLQSGAAGDTIRVLDESTKRIYRAKVIDQNHLRADL